MIIFRKFPLFSNFNSNKNKLKNAIIILLIDFSLKMNKKLQLFD